MGIFQFIVGDFPYFSFRLYLLGTWRSPLFLSVEGEGFKPTKPQSVCLSLEILAVPLRVARRLQRKSFLQSHQGPTSTRDWILWRKKIRKQPDFCAHLHLAVRKAFAEWQLGSNLLRVAGSPRSSANTRPSPVARGPADNRCGNPNSCFVASFGCKQISRVSFRSRCLPPRDRVTNHLSPPLPVRRLLARRWLFWLRHSCLAAVFATLVLLAFQVVFFGH
jgi:hypothetical protein